MDPSLANPTAYASPGRSAFGLTWPLLLVFFLANLGFTGWLAASHDKASGDALNYYAAAVNLAEGKGFTRDYKSDLGVPELKPPFATRGRFLYPALVSLAFPVLGTSIPTANFIAALFKALCVIAVMLLTKLLFDDATGLLAGILFTVAPAFNSLGSIAMPETTTVALYYFCLLALVHFYRSGRRWALWGAGLAIALAYLARPEGLFLIAFGVAVVALRSGVYRLSPWRDYGALIALPALMVTIGSWVVYGGWLVISPYERSLVTLPDWADFYNLTGLTMPQYLAQIGGLGNALAVRAFNCLLFLRHTFADGLWLERTAGLLPWTFIPACVAGLVRPLARRERMILAALSVFMLAQFALTIGFPGYPRMSADFRHGQILGPFVLILAAAGWRYLVQGGAVRTVCVRVWQAYGGLLALHLVVFCVVFLSLEIDDTLWTPSVEEPLVEAARWTQAHLPADVVLMSRKPVVINHISGQTAVIIPSANYAEIVEYARTHGVTHFVITDLERGGVPNLVEGFEVYADHFQRVATTDTFAVVAVKSYDYGGKPPTVEDDWYLQPENVRRDPFRWADLWDFRGSGAWDDVRDVWGQWIIRIRKGIWGLAKDRTIPAPMQYPVEATLIEAGGGRVTLLGFDLSAERVRPGASFELTLFWRGVQPVGRAYTVFTHVLDADGRVRAQSDRPPLAGVRPTSRWEAGEMVRDRFVLTLEPASPPGPYTVEVGLYDPATGDRMPVRDRNGADVPERRILAGSLRVK